MPRRLFSARLDLDIVLLPHRLYHPRAVRPVPENQGSDEETGVSAVIGKQSSVAAVPLVELTATWQKVFAKEIRQAARRTGSSIGHASGMQS